MSDIERDGEFAESDEYSGVERQTTKQNDDVDLNHLFGVLKHRFRLIAVVFLSVVLAGSLITLGQPRVFTATTLLMIDPSPEQVVQATQSLQRGSPNDVIVDSEIEVLSSLEMAARLAQRLGLEEDPEFNSLLRKPTAWQSLMRNAQETLDNLSAGVAPSGQANSSTALTTDTTSARLPKVPDGVARAVQSSVDVRRRGLSFAVEASFSASTPDKAARLANALVGEYMNSHLENRYESVSRANKWLDDRLSELQQEVMEKEAAVQRFRADNGLLTAEGVSLTERQIADVQNSVIQTRAQLAEAQARYDQLQDLIRSGSSIDSIAGAVNSLTVRDLRVKEAEVAQRQADLENRYGPLHPEVRKVRSERTDVQKQIQQELERLSSNLKNEAEVVRSRLRTLESNLAASRSSLISNNEQLVRLGELDAEAGAARSVYESFLQRSHEVAEQGTLAKIDARIVSPARPPGAPSSPKILFGIAISILSGLGLGVLAAMTANQFRSVFETGEDIELRTGLQNLVAVPKLEARDLRSFPPLFRSPALYLVERPFSGFVETIRALRTSIQLSKPTRQSHVVAVTSALPAEGKTSISLCLARMSAMASKKTVVVDCDARKRAINDVLGIAPRRGLLEFLNGEVELEDILGQDEETGAHIIPIAHSALLSKELFASDRMETFIEELAGRYDLVVLDCPPLLPIAEARLIASLADFTLLVVKWRDTPIRAVQAAIRMLRTARVNIAGSVLNSVHPQALKNESYAGGMYYVKASEYYGETRV